MSLLRYLYLHLLDEPTLLNQAKIARSELSDYQQRRMMPAASYRLQAELACGSYFGEHLATEELAFYSQGCVAWLRRLRCCADEQQAYTRFEADYLNAISKMRQDGFRGFEDDIAETLTSHIRQEWEHFLAGSYGVCTRHGLVEQIAKKAVATREIESMIKRAPAELDSRQRQQLNHAITYLDDVTAAFPPHEVARSSRERLLNSVRVKYVTQAE